LWLEFLGMLPERLWCDSGGLAVAAVAGGGWFRGAGGGALLDVGCAVRGGGEVRLLSTSPMKRSRRRSSGMAAISVRKVAAAAELARIVSSL
jgi:hypothetical protein